MHKIKRRIATLLIVAMSINCFAASTGDNDGSAFITKAEFDSLKNNFQSQIDTYNQSIDSKIDGAIASYLSGINLKKTEDRDIDGYTSGGWELLNEDTRDWVEGDMGFNYYLGQTRIIAGERTNASYGNVVIRASKVATDFKENIIEKKNYTDNFGLYNGYYSTKQNVALVCMRIRESNAWDSTYIIDGTNIYVKLCSWYVKFNHVADWVNNTTGATPVDGWSHSRNDWLYFGMGTTEAASSNQLGLRRGTSGEYLMPTFTATRTLGTLEKNNKVTVTAKNMALRRVSDIDPVHDFYNDDNSSTDSVGAPYHSVVNDWNDYIGGAATGNAEVWGINAADSKFYGRRFALQHADGWAVSTTVSARGTAYKPYFGFDKSISYWNDLSINAFDSLFEKINNSIDGGCTNVNDFSSDGKRLRLDAGIPMCRVSKGETITFDLNFLDTSKDYDVWIKTREFEHNMDPWGESAAQKKYIIPRDKIQFSNVLNRDTGITSDIWGCHVKGTTEVLTFTSEDNGFLFIKFAEHGKNGCGDATLLLPQTCNVSFE